MKQNWLGVKVNYNIYSTPALMLMYMYMSIKLNCHKSYKSIYCFKLKQYPYPTEGVYLDIRLFIFRDHYGEVATVASPNYLMQPGLAMVPTTKQFLGSKAGCDIWVCYRIYSGHWDLCSLMQPASK